MIHKGSNGNKDMRIRTKTTRRAKDGDSHVVGVNHNTVHETLGI